MNTEKKLPFFVIGDMESTISKNNLVGFQPIYKGTLDVSCLAGDDLTAFIKENVNDFMFQPIYKEPLSAIRLDGDNSTTFIIEHIEDLTFQPIYREGVCLFQPIYREEDASFQPIYRKDDK